MLPDFTLTITWFLAASSLVVMICLVVGARRSSVDKRLRGLAEAGSASANRTDARARRATQTSTPSVTTRENPVDQWANRRMRQMEKKNDVKERMTQAGLYRPKAVGVFITLRVILLLVPAGLGALAGKWGLIPLTHGLVFGVLAGLIGTLAPSFWLDHAKRLRQTKIRRALPDALDVLVVCLQGGLSLTGSFSRVARELANAHPMLAMEFQIIERQSQMGRTTGEAVREFAKRFDLEELRSMSSVVVQAERIGSSVVSALEVFAETLRQKRSQRAEELAQKASIKMLFPTLLFIFPGIFVVILGPAAIQIYEVLIQGVMRDAM